MPIDIPAFSLPDRNRRVLLTRRPEGVPQAGDFSIAEAAVPTIEPGRILVRNIYLSADPAQRGWASAEANYSEPVALGTPMRALAVATVVESGDPAFAPGDFLYGWFGWQDYALITPKEIFLRARQDLPLTAFGSLVGLNGITAYLALTELGRPKAGETLLVSTCAGSVGSIVGQIGRHLGCRTIGLTSDDAKVARAKEAYGYDAAINYRTGDLKAAIAATAPDGIDVYFDNTGGPILDTVLRQMRMRGRVVQCGTASTASWNPPPTGPRNEREILTRRLVWSGFIAFDYADRYEATADELARLYREGAVTFDVDVTEGIETAPGALAALYAGQNRGKRLIYVG